MLTCEHQDNIDNPEELLGPVCGQPAFWYSCSPMNQVVCNAHTCRCKSPINESFKPLIKKLRYWLYFLESKYLFEVNGDLSIYFFSKKYPKRFVCIEQSIDGEMSVEIGVLHTYEEAKEIVMEDLDETIKDIKEYLWT